MSDEVVVPEKKTRKSKAKTQYILLGQAGDGMAVLYRGAAKSEKAVWDMVDGMELVEGKHSLVLASIRGEQSVTVETKRVVTRE
jgi:hypothetical protein